MPHKLILNYGSKEREEVHVTAQIHERLIFDGEETSMACCPLIGNKRIVAQDRAECDFPFFSTGCRRGYIGTWEIKEGRFFLVGICGNFKLQSRSQR